MLTSEQNLAPGKTKLAAFVIGGLAFFVFVSRFRAIFATDPLWSWYAIPYGKLKYVAAAVIASILAMALESLISIKKNSSWPAKQSIALTAGISLAAFAVLVGNPILWFKFFAFSVFFVISIAPSKSVLTRVTGQNTSWSGAALFHLIFSSHLMFILGLMGILTRDLAFVFFSLLLILGLFAIYFDRQDILKAVNSFSKSKADYSEGILISFLVTCGGLSLVTMSAPQTYTDGIVYRIPYLQEILKTGALPFHYFNWNWVLGHPVTVFLFPYYAVAGERGATWGLFLATFTGAFVLVDFFKLLRLSLAAQLLCALLFLTTAPIWLETTSLYYDLLIALFVVESVTVFQKFVREGKFTFLFLSGLCAGFSYAIKPNGLIGVFFGMLVVLVAEKNSIPRVFRIKNAWVYGAAILIAAFPWAYWAFHISGNPFFPFLSQLSRPPFSSGAPFDKTLYPDAVFSGHLAAYLSVPWKLLVSEIGRFGEYLPGSFNPAWIALFILTALPLSYRYSKLKIGFEQMRFSGALLLLMPFAIYVTCVANGFYNFRYWMAPFMMMAVAIIFVFDQAWGKEKTVPSIIVGFCAICCLLLFGARNNYGIQTGIGDQLWRDKAAAQTFWQDKTFGLENFVNAHTSPIDSILVTNFQYIKLLHASSFYISGKLSLMGKLSNLPALSELIEGHQIRYWIVNERNKPNLPKEITDKYLLDQNIVFGSGNYTVHDLRENRPPPLSRLVWKNGVTHEVIWTAFDDKQREQTACLITNPCRMSLPIPPKATWLKNSFTLSASIFPKTVIFEYIFKDSSQNSVGRTSIARDIQTNSIYSDWYINFPQNTSSVEIAIHPWLEKDGFVQLEASEIQLLN